jgi:hypothetical protein
MTIPPAALVIAGISEVPRPWPRNADAKGVNALISCGLPAIFTRMRRGN